MRFLSREWLERMASATAGASPGATLSIHQTVTGAPDGDVEYTLRIAGGRVTFEPGLGEADVQLRSDYGTAAAISRGELSPAMAFAAGRLHVQGSVTALVAHQEVLSDLGALLAGVAPATTY
ncbi:MAG TPA: SCP2 sterol-binding domain-containing protein [Acidimicrobiales bacterium]|nr:SCP2 sterol-binding domain-containing protein [Acidimicrobiales bacterium]